MKITVTDMRAAGKPGYVARLNGKDRQFLSASGYPEGHGSSAKKIEYTIQEDGIYEVVDANFGSRKRNVTFLVVKDGEVVEESENLDDILLAGLEMPTLTGTKRAIEYAKTLIKEDCKQYMELGIPKLQTLIKQADGKDASQVIDLCKQGKLRDVLFRASMNL